MKMNFDQWLSEHGNFGADSCTPNGAYTDYEIYEDDLYGFDYTARVTIETDDVDKHKTEARVFDEIEYRRAPSNDKSSEFNDCEEIRVPKSFRVKAEELQQKIKEALANDKYRQD